MSCPAGPHPPSALQLSREDAMARKSTKRAVKKARPRAGQAPKSAKPIALYYWPTPNGHKVSIMLEELGVPYQVRPVDIGKGQQFEPAFLKISPNNRIPAKPDKARPAPPA